jgi:hypothetical protein
MLLALRQNCGKLRSRQVFDRNGLNLLDRDIGIRLANGANGSAFNGQGILAAVFLALAESARRLNSCLLEQGADLAIQGKTSGFRFSWGVPPSYTYNVSD